MSFFEGDSIKAECARIAYEILMKREWMSYQDVFDKYFELQPQRKAVSLTKWEGYGELKKAISLVKESLRSMVGEDTLEEKGSNREKCFRYVGDLDDPLVELVNARMIKSLNEYWEFCQNSAGFLPESWLEYFFKGTIQLLNLRLQQKSLEGRVMESDVNRHLTNIELLPFLYEAVKKRRKLRFTYRALSKEKIVFHPHFLKEYNGRWFLLGHAEGKQPDLAFNIAIDRIDGFPEIITDDKAFHEPDAGFYNEHFKNIVGVTHDENWPEVEEIVLRVWNYRMFNLINTKKIHSSQHVIKEYKEWEEGKKFGEFLLKVKVNNELIAQILQKGGGVEVISPPHVRSLVKKRIENMMKRYSEKDF